MAFVERKRPQFTEREALEIAQSLYRVSGDLKELPSERDQNFHIRDDSGKEFVLKIASTLEPQDTLEMQNKAMEHVAARTDFAFTQRICRSLQDNQMVAVVDASGEPHFVRMLTYLPGIPLALFQPHSISLLRNLGKTLGFMSQALRGFDHAASRRDLRWDFDRVEWVLTHFGKFIPKGKQSELVHYFLDLWRADVKPVIHSLRKSVVYHDANEYNVLVVRETPQGKQQVRLIDFGDMLYTYTFSEVAIGAAYAMLEKPDPLSTASEVVRGFHEVFPLTEEEIKLLFHFMTMRLCLSVCICAYQQQEEPENQYLKISEIPAWKTLEKLKEIHPRFAGYRLREVCDLEPHPDAGAVRIWLKEQSTGSEPVSGFDSRGGYGEVRFHDPKAFRILGNEGYEWRSIHLGLDYFVSPGTSVYSPYEGVIHSFRDNAVSGDYGPTIVVEHRAGEIPFFALYGHLSSDSLLGLYPGKSVPKGSCIGRVGTFEENGNWPPHVHSQLILDLLDQHGTFPGLCTPHNKMTWLSLCPPFDRKLEDSSSEQEGLIERRRKHISNSLSVSYQSALNIVRGKGQYLYDAFGRAYLDCVNNVAHVGHSHQKVVEAAFKQMNELNTNTRYLHQNLADYAERLCAKFPEPLSVCFFVCSGSEANDLALRLARAYTGSKNTVVLEGAYHGNLSSLIEISPYKFDGPGGSGAPPFVRKTMLPDLYRGVYKRGIPDAGEKYGNDVRAQIASFENSQPVTFIVESSPGCAGQIILPQNYLERAFHYVRDTNGVCIADEVQVGFGRVGSHFWCFQTQNVIPDIVTLGKPIGNGHPLAAVITTPKIAAVFENGMEYFNTFGGNPVSCAVGMAVLDVIEEENLQFHALEVGAYLKTALGSLMGRHSLIGDVRGLGLFLGIELVTDRKTLIPAAREASYVTERMKERGILLSTDGPDHNVIKIKPPMVFANEDADWLVQNLDVVLSEIETIDEHGRR